MKVFVFKRGPNQQATTFTSLLSKVVFSTLYADVKEHMLDHRPSKRFDLEFFRLLVSNIKMVSFAEMRSGGPDWARTSDPALIKRML
jgi:hypothetical protein